MKLFESTLLLRLLAIVLLQVTRRLTIPYPAILALAGMGVAALTHIGERDDEDARRLRMLYTAERDAARRGERPRSTQSIDALKRETLAAQRQRLIDLRSAGAIDDDVFHTLEHQLDWVELATTPPERFEMDEG